MANDKKKWIFATVRLILLCFLFIIIVRNFDAMDKKKEVNNMPEYEQTEKEDPEKYPEYEIENIEYMHFDEKFKLSNCYIRNEMSRYNHYYIDSDNVLWGYGDNRYGQLGMGVQYIESYGYESSWESKPQKIAEHVMHVDTGGVFSVYLTEKGELYGIGAEVNNEEGIEITNDIFLPEMQTITVAKEPVLLMQEVAYARCSRYGIVALQKDGSVWWWGEIQTTSSKSGSDTKGVCYPKPHKMLEDAIYVTCGSYCIGAIKTDKSLWTWGNNTFGSCGIDSGDKDFIEEPTKVANQVKMVWFDEVRFDSTIEELFEFGGSTYECIYDYVTFIEKTDGTFAACGLEVEGEGVKSQYFPLFGDIEGEIKTISFSDTFQSISFLQKERNQQLKLSKCEYGWRAEDVMAYLDETGFLYTYTYDDYLVEEKNEINEYIYIFNPECLLSFKEGKLNKFCSMAYSSRDGRIKIGMKIEEVEELFGKSIKKIIISNDDFELVKQYEENGIYYIINFYNGKVMTITEQNISYVNKK